MPLIVGGAVVGVLLLLGGIFALAGDGGGGGLGGSGGAKKVAKAYLSAWKSHETDTLVGMEYLSKSNAESLCSDYQRKVINSGNIKRIPKNVRGKLSVHTAALGEMQELNFGQSDKEVLASEILVVAYKMYFNENSPKISYTLKRVEVDGDTATAYVECSVTIQHADTPELVLLTGIASSGRFSLVRINGKWKISR